MKRICGLILIALLAGCDEKKEGALAENAVALCKTAVEMTVGTPPSFKWLSSWDASGENEIAAKEARMRIPASVEHVIAVSFGLDREAGHHDGRAYCGFKGKPEDLNVQHIVIDERVLDTFSMDEVVRRYKAHDVSKGERL